MNGRRRNATNAQIWGKKNDSNYDGNCIARHCLSGTNEVSRRWIFVRLSVRIRRVSRVDCDHIMHLRISRQGQWWNPETPIPHQTAFMW